MTATSVRLRWLVLHRWIGLGLAAFLVLSGVTGAIIAFKDPLDRALNPDLLRATESSEARLSPLQLREIALRHAPGASADYVTLDRKPGYSALVYLGGMPYNQLYLDPYSGEVRGERWDQAYDWDRKHLLSTIFWLHRALLVRDSWGMWLLGTIAIVWLIASLIGFYLALPVRRKNFLGAWKRSWLVRPSRSVPQLSFDLHRAAGSWTFLVMIVLAVSGVRLNLYDGVYRPIASTVLDYTDTTASFEPPAQPMAEPPLDWETAWARGKELMAARAQRTPFAIHNESWMALDRERAFYQYAVNSTLDIRDRIGETVVYFSAIDGRELGFTHVYATSGKAVDAWLEALHRSHVWGLSFRVFLSLMGVVVAVMSITGVLVWFKRRYPATSRAAAGS